MISLPIDAGIPSVMESLRGARNLVLVASPGAGKTTRVPPALLKSGLLSVQHPGCVMLQPRRIAARASAQRIAEEMNVEVGEEVGYQVRFENRRGPKTRLTVVTEGILARWLQDNPTLEGIGAVILDEFHERSLHTDLAIGLLKEIQSSVREDLRIIVMSATLETEALAHYLDDCPVLKFDGRIFPIEVSHRPRTGIWSDLWGLPKEVAAAVQKVVDDPQDDGGHVLVFLPGLGEIRRCLEGLESWGRARGLAVMPLHGTLSLSEQNAVLKPLAKNSPFARKIILATNIAETSLTIDGVSAVIDSGLAKVMRCDPKSGLERLELSRISMASVTQRSGRAGRQRPGRSVRLWSKNEESQFRGSETPELQRADLSSTCLTLADWGVNDPLRFSWFEAPPSAQIQSSQSLLRMLGLLDREGRITSLGRAVVSLPVHPRWGRVLIGAALQEDPYWLQAAAKEAASLERSRSDEIREQLVRQAQRAVGTVSRKEAYVETHSLEEILLLGFPDRVTRRRTSGSEKALMVGGRGVVLDPRLEDKTTEIFLSLDPEDVKSKGKLEARVSKILPLDKESLKRIFPDAVALKRESRWDEVKGALMATATECFWDLPLSEPASVPVDPTEATELLVKSVSAQPRSFFESMEAPTNWLARRAYWDRWNPDSDFPPLSDELLRDLISQFAAGQKRLEGLKALDWVGALESTLSYAQKKKFDEEVPESITVPSGSRIRVLYAPDGAEATLSVRLQEIFGWTESPKLAGGKASLTMELLGPNYRPAQITKDLMSFWTRGYPEVRKELRIRYPKHSWPEDPFTARAEAKGRHRPR